MIGLGKKTPGQKVNKDGFSLNASYDEGLMVITMPERFRHAHESASKATKSGILILISGIIILVTMLILAYFFVIKPRPEETAEVNNPPEALAPAAVIPPAVVTPLPPKEEPPTPAAEELPAVITPTPSPATAEEEASSAPATASSTLETEAAAGTSTPMIPPVALPAADSDNDGLLDLEEAVFGTKIDAADSDGDGYSDLAEVINFYNPAGTGKVSANPNFVAYLNPTFSYRLYYPKAWTTSTFGGDDSVMFSIGNNQFIQAIVQPNSEKKAINDWYTAQFGAEHFSPNRVLNGPNWIGVVSEDDLIIYLTDAKKEYLVTLTYNLGPANTAYYLNIFRLMIKSLTFDASGN
jgi:hypothetical protein